MVFTFIPFPTEAVFLHQEPLSSGLFGMLLRAPFSFLPLSIVLSGLLSFIQALLINQIVNSNKILSRKNYLPGLAFVIFASFLPSYLLLSPASVSFTFLILAVGKIFSIVRREKANSDIFDIGFLVAIAALFYFPAMLFLIFAYVGLATVRAFSYREWIIILLGFVTPFFLLFTFYFWHDDTASMLTNIANVHSEQWMTGISFSQIEWILLAVFGFFALMSLLILPSALYASVIQTRKFSLLLVVFMFFTLVSLVLLQQADSAHLLWLSLPLAIILPMHLMQVKRDWIYEVIHLILILLVLAGQYFPLFKIN